MIAGLEFRRSHTGRIDYILLLSQVCVCFVCFDLSIWDVGNTDNHMTPKVRGPWTAVIMRRRFIVDRPTYAFNFPPRNDILSKKEENNSVGASAAYIAFLLEPYP